MCKFKGHPFELIFIFFNLGNNFYLIRVQGWIIRSAVLPLGSFLYPQMGEIEKETNPKQTTHKGK